MIIDHDVTFKFLDPKKLAAALGEVPDGCVVSVNGVGNLAVHSKAGDSFEFVGFIDFVGDGEFIVC